MGACAGLTYDRASFHLRQYIGAACLSLLQAWWRGASCRCQCTLFRGPSLGRRRRSLRLAVSSSALMRAAFSLQAWYRAHSHSAVPALREASVLFCHFTFPLFPSVGAVHGWLRATLLQAGWSSAWCGSSALFEMASCFIQLGFGHLPRFASMPVGIRQRLFLPVHAPRNSSQVAALSQFHVHLYSSCTVRDYLTQLPVLAAWLGWLARRAVGASAAAFRRAAFVCGSVVGRLFVAGLSRRSRRVRLRWLATF